METLLVYDSKFGNTKKIAEIITAELKPYSALHLYGPDRGLPHRLGAIDLLIVGGPTQAHGMSARIRQFTDGLEPGSAVGMVAVAFDTRFRMPAAITGSAAKTIAKRLSRAGIRVCLPPESFFVTRGGTPRLEAGEAERAAGWAKDLLTRRLLSTWCAA